MPGIDDLMDLTYKNRYTYVQLSKEFRQLFPAVVRAYQLIPMIYNVLTQVDMLSHKGACNKIYNDHKDMPGFSRRNIYRNLPSDNPNVPRRVVPPRHKSIDTEYDVVPELSITKSKNLVEGYSEGHNTVEYSSDAQEYPRCADPLVKHQELEEANFPKTGTVGTQYQIPKEKFEILTIALKKSRHVCFVLFDTNGEFVKADADIDKVTHVSTKSKNDK